MLSVPAKGTTAENPFRLCAITDISSFGDFFSVLFFVRSVAAQFEHSRITFVYRNNHDYKTTLLPLLAPNSVMACAPDGLMPTLDLFNYPVRGRMPQQLSAWMSAGLFEQDLILTDAMMRPSLLCSFEPPAYLSFPTDTAASLFPELVKLGLSPDRWFCCIHCREPGYKYKPEGANFRDSDPQGFLVLRDHVIDVLGGQVVRLGHPKMTPFPPRKGFVDLSRFDGNSLLQAFATSRARFVVATASGADPMGHALGVPTATINCVNYFQASFHDLKCTPELVLKDGTVLSQQALMDRGLEKREILKAIKDGGIVDFRQNSPAELIIVANQLFQETSSVIAWRAPLASAVRAPNSLAWPRQAINKVRFVSSAPAQAIA